MKSNSRLFWFCGFGIFILLSAMKPNYIDSNPTNTTVDCNAIIDSLSKELEKIKHEIANSITIQKYQNSVIDSMQLDINGKNFIISDLRSDNSILSKKIFQLKFDNDLEKIIRSNDTSLIVH